MKEYQDLTIFIDEDNTEVFLQRIKDKLNILKNWQEVIEVKKEGNWTRYQYSNQASVAIARLFLFEEPYGLFKVTQIIPIDADFLPKTFYNKILGDFKNEIIDPILVDWDKPGRAELTRGTILPEDRLTPAVLKQFELFVKAANKAELHPYDEKRWRDFIIKIYRSNCDLSSSELQAFLIEDYDWPGESAHKLAVRFEEAIDLLKDYATFQIAGDS